MSTSSGVFSSLHQSSVFMYVLILRMHPLPPLPPPLSPARAVWRIFGTNDICDHQPLIFQNITPCFLSFYSLSLSVVTKQRLLKITVFGGIWERSCLQIWVILQPAGGETHMMSLSNVKVNRLCRFCSLLFYTFTAILNFWQDQKIPSSNNWECSFTHSWRKLRFQ